MPNNTQLVETLDRWMQWLQMCINLPITAPVCRPMWQWVMYICFTVGALTISWLVWKFVDYKLKYAAAIRAQLERERIADPEVMADHRYKEIADIEADVTDPHLAKKIRAELEKQRLERVSGQPKV